MMSVSGVSLPLAAEAPAPAPASSSLGPTLALPVPTSPMALMAPMVSVDDGIYSIGPLKMLILWSIPAVTLYFLMVRFDSSCSSSTDGEAAEGCGCNVNIFCTSQQLVPLLVDEISYSMNESSSFGTSCQLIIGMSGRPEVSKSCLQESLVCAACVQQHATFLDNEDQLIRSILVYPIKGAGAGAGHGHRRAMFAFEGGAVDLVYWQTHFPGSVGAAAAASSSTSSSRRSKLLENDEGEDQEQDEAEEEESFVCLGHDAVVSGVTNLSAYFEMYHKGQDE